MHRIYGNVTSSRVSAGIGAFGLTAKGYRWHRCPCMIIGVRAVGRWRRDCSVTVSIQKIAVICTALAFAAGKSRGRAGTRVVGSVAQEWVAGWC